jgi:hypothetical protein
MEEVVGEHADHGRRELLQDVGREGFELLRAELHDLLRLEQCQLFGSECAKLRGLHGGEVRGG